MNKKSYVLLPLALLSVVTANADIIKGVVESINPQTNEAKIRTANKDYVVKIYETLPAVQTALRSAQAKTSIQTFDIPSSAIVSQTDAPMRADCSELPVSMDDLGKLATSSEDMLDFLKKIPEGSLQGFTFITNSLSLHRGVKDKDGNGQVSPLWPRVLRSSADGKITVSFVCDPKNPTYGKVEILSFDDAKNEFKTTEFDFGHPNASKVSPKDRIHENPTSCISCHARSTINGKVSLKPNWPEYFFWSDCKEDRGIQMYGSSDDNMGPSAYRNRLRVNSTKDLTGCDNQTDQAMVDKEKRDFKNFRETQKNNECFNTLPWKNAANMGKHAEFYPYSDDAQNRDNNGKQNYARRTNARFTDTYSHLMAKRNASHIAKSKEYEKVKYFLAMEEAGCFTNEDEQELKRIMPDFNIDKSVRYSYSSSDYSVEASAPLLLSYSKRIGMTNADWTMEFREDKDPNYNAVMFYGLSSGDAKIHNVTAGNILKDIGNSNPAMKSVADTNITKGITDVFGSNFSCIDDLGGAVHPRNKSRNSELCKKLHEENKKHLDTINLADITCEECKSRTPATTPPVDLESQVSPLIRSFTNDQISKGKALVEEGGKGSCVLCHSTGADRLPTDYQFVPSDKDSKRAQSMAVLRSKPASFLSTLEKRLITDKTMPPPPQGKDLTDEDREAIRAYILSLIPNK